MLPCLYYAINPANKGDEQTKGTSKQRGRTSLLCTETSCVPFVLPIHVASLASLKGRSLL